MVIYIANKIVMQGISLCYASVPVYNDKLFYTLHRGRSRISNKEGLGVGGLVHCDRVCIGRPIFSRWGGGGGMREEGARKIIFILRLWKHYFSFWTLLKMAVQH